MSTSGKYGERQSWRRKDAGQVGKRRTTKTVLTVISLLLTAIFLYLVLRPTPDRNLHTLLVSNSYDIGLITPPMFADNVRAQFEQQLGASVLYGDQDSIRSSFHTTDSISKYLADKDDTVMVVLRGYLMLDQQRRPALACTDLSIGPTPEQPGGLLPLTEILNPLSSNTPDSFAGARLVVLDIEPLAAQPSLGQWNDDVFATLDETMKQLPGAAADRLWLLVTRGPLQNVGWDQSTKLPLSTQMLLQGFGGKADLNQDRMVELDELCAFLTDRYERLPRKQDTDKPRILLLRGGHGLVDEKMASSGDLDVWLARVDAPDPVEPSSSVEPPANGDQQNAADVEVTSVSLQSTERNQSDAPPTPDSPTDGDSPEINQPSDDQPAADITHPPDTAPVNASGSAVPVESFWDLRDRLESFVPVDESQQRTSPIALAPQLWRQLILKVLGAQIAQFDPGSTSTTSEQITNDLRQLERVLSGDQPSAVVSDDIVTELLRVVQKQQRDRQNSRIDRRLNTADALQHAIAIARCRLWSQLEFQCQSISSDTGVPENRLDSVTLAAERTLASGQADQTPSQIEMEARLTDLNNAIALFDRDIDTAVSGLLTEFDRGDPQRGWELSRAGWSWLRSPLPTAGQRRDLYAAIIATAKIWPQPDTASNSSDVIDPKHLVFASPLPATRPQQAVAALRAKWNGFQDFDSGIASGRGDANWIDWLQQTRQGSVSFADRFATELRIDPRVHLPTVGQIPIIHRITALPKVRRPGITILDSAGNSLAESAVIRMESLQDTTSLTLRLRPDRDQETRLLVSYQLRSNGAESGESPVAVKWKVDGHASAGPRDPIPVTIAAEATRDLSLEIRPTAVAEPGQQLVFEFMINGDRQSDQIKQIVGVHRLPVELPRKNQLRVVASSYRGIGCSKPMISDDGGLPGGIWLRTFNQRKTPFQLELFNESGKPCQATVWLIKLPNPMPDVNGYWPDFAADLYSNPVGGMLLSGRIRREYLRADRILKGPATVSVPGAAGRVKLNFKPPEPAKTEGAAAVASPAAASPASAVANDVSHGMALVCRLIDDQGNPLPEDDQVIVLVAKPWAPKDYVSAKVRYDDGEVVVDSELAERIDGDSVKDEIPEIEKRPVVVRWLEDNQWDSFQPETSNPPDQRVMELRQQAGQSVGYIKVDVPPRRRQTWARLEVDGWPRAIQQVVDHQRGSLGQPKLKDQVTFESLALTFRKIADASPPPQAYYWPESEVYFRGNGLQLIATLQSDFAVGTFNRNSQPEIRLEVESRPDSVYRTDRLIRTQATEISDDGVLTLLTSVDDLQAQLQQGQRADDRIPITSTLMVQGREVTSQTITAVLDSTPPDSITLSPKRFAPYLAPGKLGFSVSANDSGRDAAGIAQIVLGLDTKQDGKPDTQRKTQTFSPPVSTAVVAADTSEFQFQVAGRYAVIATAIDASGNESTTQYPLDFEKPKPIVKPTPVDPAAMNGGKPAAEPKMGWLHGVINTRAGISGTLTLDAAPNTANSKSKSILGQDRRFNFGPVPEGEYTLKFKGAISNKLKSLSWPGLKADVTANKSKPLSLDLDAAEE
ncbi:hypothetical protein NHH03_05095 [Stieleria sp. TO1_6]|uniref:hypothetical protein n=1 Tax=Stieleria tagensis TaxID=2956795 RepID=UPI00209BA90E|nr:hypothetical protein [Stieleria tagensis]MCO8121105.1 hypothetical protein [Stieleria tagensis]